MATVRAGGDSMSVLSFGNREIRVKNLLGNLFSEVFCFFFLFVKTLVSVKICNRKQKIQIQLFSLIRENGGTGCEISDLRSGEDTGDSSDSNSANVDGSLQRRIGPRLHQ